MHVVEAGFLLLVELSETSWGLTNRLRHDFYGVATPRAVAGMELQSLAIDLLTVIEQLAKGVGRVEERPDPNRRLWAVMNACQSGAQKPSWCTQSLPSK